MGLSPAWCAARAGFPDSGPGRAVGRRAVRPAASQRGAACGGDDPRWPAGGRRAPGQPAPQSRPRARRQLRALGAP
ncbi:hypothetical protein G6F68_018154 [Rhizopus microsporus]|nr:hypothetical protein G6F68_018154 [Rhizopus microsporus]